MPPKRGREKSTSEFRLGYTTFYFFLTSTLDKSGSPWARFCCPLGSWAQNGASVWGGGEEGRGEREGEASKEAKQVSVCVCVQRQVAGGRLVRIGSKCHISGTIALGYIPLPARLSLLSN